MVGVAQLAEHLVVAQDAAGSRPVTHPIQLKYQGAHAPFLFFRQGQIPKHANLSFTPYFP